MLVVLELSLSNFNIIDDPKCDKGKGTQQK
jgi:hypothetical protein